MSKATDNIKQLVAGALDAMDAGEYHVAFLRLHAATQATATEMVNDQFAKGQQSVMGMWHPRAPAIGDEVRL